MIARAQDLSLDTSGLEACLGKDNVILDEAERRYYSADVYCEGAVCAAAIKPRTTQDLAAAAPLITSQGFALLPRGGGMSYTGGYITDSSQTVVVDTGAMEPVMDIDADNMLVTVSASITWEMLYEALKPKGLRLPFFGTFSGSRATVGGGLSNGALFMGTARYGTGGDNTLGLKVVLGDGRIITTGQKAFGSRHGFYRTYGPDLTGLFLHDCGALGIKTEATLKLMQMPAAQGCLSFAFPDIESVARAMSAVGRTGAAEEAYVFDPETTRKNLSGGSLKEDAKTLGKVVKGQSSWVEGLKAGAQLVAKGRDFVPEDVFSLHIVCAGRSEASVADDLAICRAAAEGEGGEDIPNSIPMAARANPFGPLNGVLGPEGDRWAALNAKVAHTEAAEVIRRFDAILEPHQDEMKRLGVTLSRLMIAIDTHAFSFEPVFRWFDYWLPVHQRVPEPSHLAKLKEPPPNPEAAALVEKMRGEVVALFADMGAASNQIGRTYRYADLLDADTRGLLDALKQHVDPEGRVNPGVLGF